MKLLIERRTRRFETSISLLFQLDLSTDVSCWRFPRKHKQCEVEENITLRKHRKVVHVKIKYFFFHV
jgi:hypothetical protein